MLSAYYSATGHMLSYLAATSIIKYHTMIACNNFWDDKKK